jgi:hypothetical protein
MKVNSIIILESGQEHSMNLVSNQIYVRAHMWLGLTLEAQCTSRDNQMTRKGSNVGVKTPYISENHKEIMITLQ